MNVSVGLHLHQFIHPFFLHWLELSTSYIPGKAMEAEGMTGKAGSLHTPGIHSVRGKKEQTLKQIIRIQYQNFYSENTNWMF